MSTFRAKSLSRTDHKLKCPELIQAFGISVLRCLDISPKKWIVRGAPSSVKHCTFALLNSGKASLKVTVTPNHPWIGVEPKRAIISSEDSKDVDARVKIPERTYRIGFLRFDASEGEHRDSSLAGVLTHANRPVVNVDLHEIKRIFDRRLEEYYEVFKRSGFTSFP